MLITIRELREIISNQLVEARIKDLARQLLSEGAIDDVKAKSNRSPEEWDEVLEKLQALPQAKLRQYLMWLERVSRSNQEPLRDISPLIISFDGAKSRQKLKGKDADINSYRTAGDLHRKLEELPDDSKIDFKAASGDADKVYESDNFIVLMPRSIQASCAIGKGTTWCTARTKGENLFYSYILEGTTSLYYVLDKHDENKKWSIGTIGGEVQPSHPNEMTVNQNNQQFDFQEAFGDEWPKIHAAIEMSRAIDDVHPAIRDIKKAVTSVPRFKKFAQGLRPPAFVATTNQFKNIAGLKPTKDVQDYIIVLNNHHYSKMSKSKDVRIRQDVAYNTSVHVDTLRELAKDKDATVRHCAASNPNTPVDSLKELAKDPDETTRYNTLLNPNIPVDTLRELVKSKDKQTKRGIASNPNTPPDSLEELAKDNDHQTRQNAASNNMPPETLRELSKDPGANVRRAVAMNHRTPGDVLKALIKDKAAGVRWGLANNPNISPDILRVLAKDPNSSVKTCVGLNKNTPDDVLFALLKDEDIDVKWAASRA